jgi:hypothetical protein
VKPHLDLTGVSACLGKGMVRHTARNYALTLMFSKYTLFKEAPCHCPFYMRPVTELLVSNKDLKGEYPYLSFVVWTRASDIYRIICSLYVQLATAPLVSGGARKGEVMGSTPLESVVNLFL